MIIFQPTFIQSNNQKNNITISNDHNTSSNIIKPMNSFNQTLQIINNSSLNEHSKSLNKNKTKEFNDTNIYNNSKVNIKKNKPSKIIINNNININIGNLYKTYTNNYTTITKKPISNNYFKTNTFNSYK
jgi:hypothetical protein